MRLLAFCPASLRAERDSNLARSEHTYRAVFEAFLPLLARLGQLTVVRDPARDITLADSRAIAEYFEETVDRAPMINGTAANRAEIRRLVALFDENFFGDVTLPLLHERMKKRLILREPPDSRVLREAMKLAHGHLDYIDWLVDTRPWLAGPQMSLADLAAAASAKIPGLRLLYTSGYSRSALDRQGRLEPGVELMRKPFEVDDLARRVREILDA